MITNTNAPTVVVSKFMKQTSDLQEDFLIITVEDLSMLLSTMDT